MNTFTLHRLRLLSKASGAPMSRIIDQAIDEFVEKILRENSGIRERYKKEDEKNRPKPKLTIVK